MKRYLYLNRPQSSTLIPVYYHDPEGSLVSTREKTAKIIHLHLPLVFRKNHRGCHSLQFLSKLFLPLNFFSQQQQQQTQDFSLLFSQNQWNLSLDCQLFLVSRLCMYVLGYLQFSAFSGILLVLSIMLHWTSAQYRHHFQTSYWRGFC